MSKYFIEYKAYGKRLELVGVGSDIIDIVEPVTMTKILSKLCPELLLKDNESIHISMVNKLATEPITTVTQRIINI